MSNKAQHTQGPWRIGMRNGANANTIYARNGADNYSDDGICTVYEIWQHSNIEEVQQCKGIANARLIAAAPELLEALDESTSAIRELVGVIVKHGLAADGKFDGIWEWLNSTCEQADAAIAKAKGE